jgi:hypothetical protein
MQCSTVVNRHVYPHAAPLRWRCEWDEEGGGRRKGGKKKRGEEVEEKRDEEREEEKKEERKGAKKKDTDVEYGWKKHVHQRPTELKTKQIS